MTAHPDDSSRSADQPDSAMHPTGGGPFGAEKLPREQPRPDATDLTNQAALQSGASSRWLVPSAILAGVAIVLFVIAFQLQLLIPIVGIVFVAAMWIAMFVVARGTGDIRSRNRRLAWLMGGMAVGAVVLFFALYAWEASL